MRKLLLFLLGLLPLLAHGQYSGTGVVSLTAPAGASSIQWYNLTSGSPVAISGQTSATYAASATGIYYATFQQGGKGDCSDYIIVIQQGSSAILNGATNNTGGSNYQWYRENALVTGATTANYTATTGGTYRFEFDNGDTCSIKSDNYQVYTLLAVVPPTVAITTPLNITTTNTNPPVSGTATPLASVTVNGPNNQKCVTTASAAGSWTCTSLTFTVGSQTVTAVASNSSGVSNTATASFTVVTPPCPNPSVGGSTTFVGTLPLCNVTNMGTISLSGQTGTVVKWQTSTTGGSTWTDIANTTASLTFTNAANNQQYRAVVNNGGNCADANSSPTTISTSAGACTANCAVLPGTIAK